MTATASPQPLTTPQRCVLNHPLTNQLLVSHPHNNLFLPLFFLSLSILLLLQNIVGFHHQQDDGSDASESDYEGVGEYLERLGREEAEMLASGAMLGESGGVGPGVAAASAAAGSNSSSGGGGGGGSGGGSVGSSACQSLPSGSNGGGIARQVSFEQGAAAAAAAAGGGASAAVSIGEGGIAGNRRARAHSDADSAVLDEASALLRSKEELFAMLKRSREAARRNLERALAAEAEVSILRGAVTSTSGANTSSGGSASDLSAGGRPAKG